MRNTPPPPKKKNPFNMAKVELFLFLSYFVLFLKKNLSWIFLEMYLLLLVC